MNREDEIEKPKPVKEIDDQDLLELVCQLSGRLAMYPSEEMHNAFWEARNELNTRIAGYSSSQASNAGEWQVCPKCNGQGSVSKPPWLAGDVDQWTSSETQYDCDVCKGAKILLKPMFPESASPQPSPPEQGKEDWQNIISIMLDTHVEFLPHSDPTHEDSELYMIMAKRIARWTEQGNSEQVGKEAIEFLKWINVDMKFTNVLFKGETRWCTVEVAEYGSSNDSDYMTISYLYKLFNPKWAEQADTPTVDELKTKFAQHLGVPDLETSDAYAVEWVVKNLIL